VEALRTSRLPLAVVIYLACIVIPIGFHVGPLAMTTLRLFLLVMLIPLTIQLLSGKFGRLILTDYLFFLHIGWAVVALAVNNPDRVVQQAGSVGVEFLGGYLVGRAYIRTPEAFAALCRALVVIVLCTLPFALHETITGRAIVLEFIRKLPGLTSYEINNNEPRLGLERVQLFLAHPIHYGVFCSVAFSIAFVALDGISTSVWRYTTSALIALAGFLALSSGALLAIVLQVGLIAWAAVFTEVKWRWWLLVGLLTLAYVVIDLISNRTPVQVFMSYATFSAHTAYFRGIIFEWGMVNVWANPIFGIGLNDWVRPSYMTSGTVDNFWLVIALRFGIPGFLFLALGYAYLLYRVIRRDFEGNRTLAMFRRAWVFTFLGLSFALCTVHIWASIYSFVFFVLGAGVWLISVSSDSTSFAMEPESGPMRIGDRSLRTSDRLTPYTRFASKRISRNEVL
jgi:hypothetical protein